MYEHSELVLFIQPRTRLPALRKDAPSYQVPETRISPHRNHLYVHDQIMMVRVSTFDPEQSRICTD